ncbi:MAG: YwiC-like family protein [Deltaproteobacteria bacterium]|nr:YwiC-like family protein [Deltaproteobacteria bacterium]
MVRQLLPREHGAYAQLAFPLLSGLLLGKPAASAVGFAATAILFFLAHEPVAILLGIRGARLNRELAGIARRRAHLLVSGGLLSGLAALFTAPPEAKLLAVIPLVLLAALAFFIFTKNVKTLAAEVIIAGCFASMHLPVGYVSGVRSVLLGGPALIWFVCFVGGILSVHAIKRRRLGHRGWMEHAAVAMSGGTLFFAMALAFSKTGYQLIGRAALIPAAVLFGVNLLRVHPRSLKIIGWSLVAANTAALIVLIGAAR